VALLSPYKRLDKLRHTRFMSRVPTTLLIYHHHHSTLPDQSPDQEFLHQSLITDLCHPATAKIIKILTFFLSTLFITLAVNFTHG
jgi:hypothetical protein